MKAEMGTCREQCRAKQISKKAQQEVHLSPGTICGGMIMKVTTRLMKATRTTSLVGALWKENVGEEVVIAVGEGRIPATSDGDEERGEEPSLESRIGIMLGSVGG